ncbi:F-box only protein 46-like, partial [Malurus melanocephalus]|uniref:F-box only protein 46-like n=1 Tax=Malurus melanocephalus TaxID=175006 RepID=UPI002549B97C
PKAPPRRHQPSLRRPGRPPAAWPCHAVLMEPNAFPQLQLWCPRPFGTFSQNKPCAPAGATPAAPRKPLGCRPSENIPPEPPEPSPAPAAAAEDGRVLLDTWYVIKPGNTKEKVAFFVAHQCGTGGAGGTGGRASTMKVKGNWGSDSSKAKRRRRCHEPKAAPSPPWAGSSTGDTPKDPPKDIPKDTPGDTAGDSAGDTPDLLSVAEMVALVERRTALALQSLPRPCDAPAPLVLLEAPGGPECRRVAAAVAQFESQQQHRERGGVRPNGLCRGGPATECAPGTATTATTATPGEVRIAFRI